MVRAAAFTSLLAAAPVLSIEAACIVMAEASLLALSSYTGLIRSDSAMASLAGLSIAPAPAADLPATAAPEDTAMSSAIGAPPAFAIFSAAMDADASAILPAAEPAESARTLAPDAS
jgi:hypothetical protein